MADARVRKWCANDLAYLVRLPMLRKHPSPIGNGWELVNDHCQPIRYRRSALPDHLLQVANIDETNENTTLIKDASTEIL